MTNILTYVNKRMNFITNYIGGDSVLIFKIIIGIIGTGLLVKSIELDNTTKAYDYFFDALIIFSIILLVHPVV